MEKARENPANFNLCTYNAEDSGILPCFVVLICRQYRTASYSGITTQYGVGWMRNISDGRRPWL